MRPDEQLAQLGLPVTPANVEALRTARAVEDFKDNLLDDEAVRLRLFALAALQRVAGQKLAKARRAPRNCLVADSLRCLADAMRVRCRARGEKLWPTVRDRLVAMYNNGDVFASGVELTDISEPDAFGEAHAQDELAGITITFKLPDGTLKTKGAQTAYKHIMSKAG